MNKVHIDDVMTSSGVGFGTSGVRGLVDDMTDEICWLYVTAFLQYLTSQSIIQYGDKVGIAGDLRNSTDRIMQSVSAAIVDFGLIPINYGAIPSPAIALYGLDENMTTMMITGSHIPDDRNGIKFNLPTGEMLKVDELAIKAQVVRLPENKFDAKGMLIAERQLVSITEDASDYYEARFLDFFPTQCLQGLYIGVYQHSSVVRDCLTDLLQKLGATVLPLGRSERFIAVDTEAIRPEDVLLAKQWAEHYSFDCIVSTDGDGDRPLISDEKGDWLRGDVAGSLCARYLDADAVVTPVSSNTSVDKSHFFKRVVRTKIGSPYVIAAMNELGTDLNVVGYEANGGFLQANNITKNGKTLSALPTRDAIIVMLSIMMLAKDKQMSISELVDTLPKRFTHSDRLKNFPPALSQQKLGEMIAGETVDNFLSIKSQFDFAGEPVALDCTDGVRITFENEDIIHLRPSGNAPELRCYTESSTQEQAVSLNKLCLTVLTEWSLTDS